MELLLNGKFNDSERQELSKNLNIEVREYVTKAIDFEEIVRLIFRDFDAFTLLRDGALFGLLLKLVKKSINWLKSKKPKAKIQIASQLIFADNKKSFSVNIGLPIKEDKKFWKELENEITLEFVEKAKDKEIINISWDDDKKRFKITKI